jgi:hypothetical protein
LPAPKYPVKSVNGILGRSSGREGPASGSSDSRRLSVRSFFHEDTCDLTDSGTSSISISVLIMYDMASYFILVSGNPGGHVPVKIGLLYLRNSARLYD